MIDFDFNYYLSDSYAQAIELFYKLNAYENKAIYFNGGTEIITFAESNRIKFNDVISISHIEDTNAFGISDDFLIIGSSVILGYIENTIVFPSLSETCGFVADHSSRSKITIGGNLCGKIPFKGAILPLMLLNTEVLIGDNHGLRYEQILDVYNRGYKLKGNELVIHFRIRSDCLHFPFFNKKVRQTGEFGYPLVAVSLIMDNNNNIRAAFSGICSNAFVSEKMNYFLNQSNLSITSRVDNAINNMDCNVKNDLQGSASYRLYVLKQTLIEGITKLSEH